MTLTLILVIFTCLISYQGIRNYAIVERFKHNPLRESRYKEYFRLLTSGFLHGDWAHLAINMFVLYSFGDYMERYFTHQFGEGAGKIIFLAAYLVNIILANIPTLLKHRDEPGFSSIGASGAVSGIIFMFILLNPWQMIHLFFVIPIPAVLAGVGYLAYSSFASKNERGRIDHSAHFAGAIAGMFILAILSPKVIADFGTKVIRDFPLL